MRAFALVCLAACGGAAPVAPVPRATAATSTAFYSQRLESGGIPILAHASVSSRGLAAARDRLELLLKNAPRLRRNLEASHYELHVFGLEQFASDLPEYASRRGSYERGQLFDWHMIGGHISESAGHFSSCAEGTLLPIVGHRLFGDDTCVHELAHVIDWFALDAANRARLDVAYHASIDAGLWKGQYAASNVHEWFAEVTKYFFRADHKDLAFYDPSLARGHAWLCGYDPTACQLADDLYGDRIDPGTPKTVVVSADANREGSLKSGFGRVPARVVVRNRSKERVHLVWLDTEGKRDARIAFADLPSVAPGGDRALFTWATHAYVITDDAENALCTFSAVEDEAIVDVTGKCP